MGLKQRQVAKLLVDIPLILTPLRQSKVTPLS